MAAWPGQFDGSDDGEIPVADNEIDVPSGHPGKLPGFAAAAQLGQLGDADLDEDLHAGHGFAEPVIK